LKTDSACSKDVVFAEADSEFVHLYMLM